MCITHICVRVHYKFDKYKLPYCQERNIQTLYALFKTYIYIDSIISETENKTNKRLMSL